ncbi:MAG: tripartite tricarboxylate transporter substrate binding protein [Burkholderiales bacterium]|nr:tripartite tricarboxylate transporter substrate binding protein [Burkholderiales bacterium]
MTNESMRDGALASAVPAGRHVRRRTAIAALSAAAFGALLAAELAGAADFPHKPVRLVIPSAPGGGTDIVARILGQRLGQIWRSPLVVENVSGGATAIGTAAVAKAPADGYTVLMTGVNFTFVPLVRSKLPYDVAGDFEPVMLATQLASLIVVHPSMPVKSLRELIALARARPGEIRYGSGGSGTVIHFSTELFRLAAGIRLLHVPYRGAGPATAAVLGGETQMLITTLAALDPHLQSKKLRALATTGAQRARAAPGVPTAVEAGLPGYTFDNWYGLWAPARTPRAVVQALNEAFNQALAAPEVIERLAAVGVDPVGGPPEKFAAYLAAELARWREVARAADIKAE